MANINLDIDVDLELFEIDDLIIEIENDGYIVINESGLINKGKIELFKEKYKNIPLTDIENFLNKY